MKYGFDCANQWVESQLNSSNVEPAETRLRVTFMYLVEIWLKIADLKIRRILVSLQTKQSSKFLIKYIPIQASVSHNLTLFSPHFQ